MEQIVVPTRKLQCPSCKEPVFQLKDLLPERIRCPACSKELAQGTDYPVASGLIKSFVDEARQITRTDPENALVLLNAALDADDLNAEAHSLAGMVFDEQGDTPTAFYHLNRAVELDPRRSKFHYELGVALMMIDEWPRAQAEFEKALEILPDYLKALNNLVMCYLTQSDWVAAAIVCDRLMALDPDGPIGRNATEMFRELRNNLPDKQAQQIIQRIAAAFRFESQGNWKEATELFEQCKEELPREGPAWCMVCEYLSNHRMKLNQHYACLDLTSQARKYLPCVAAIARGPLIPIFEAGMDKDADRLYKRLLEEEFGVTDPLIVKVRDGQGKFLGMRASVSGQDFDLQRVGNVVRIVSAEGMRELSVYEDSYSSINNMY